MRGRQKMLFCQYLFFDGSLIFSWWWVVRWSWKPDSGPAEIASFCWRDFNQRNKHDTFWHVVLIRYCYSFLLWAIAVSNFRPLEIDKNLGLPLSAITFTVNSHTDKQFNKHIYFFQIYCMKSVFSSKYTLGLSYSNLM